MAEASAIANNPTNTNGSCRCSESILKVFQTRSKDFDTIRDGIAETREKVELEELYRQDNPFPLVFSCRNHDHAIIRCHPEATPDPIPTPMVPPNGRAMVGPSNPKVQERKNNLAEIIAEYNFFLTGYEYLIETGMFKASLGNLRDDFTKESNSGSGHLSEDQIKTFFGIERKPEETPIQHYLRAVDVFLYLLVKYAHPNIIHPQPESQRLRVGNLLVFANLVVNYRNNITNPNESHQLVFDKWKNVVSVLEALFNIQMEMHYEK